LTFIVTFFCTSALLYPYTFVETMSTTAAAFFLQFFLEGALGLIPIHMMELSPPSLRASAVGTMYQLGNLASSASITIEAKLGERFPLPSTTPGVKRYNYGLVICIFTACCMVYNIIVVYLGPENRGASFDVEDDPRMKQLVGEEGVQKAV
jgi:SHS family lactate transporter-like MFS transporter